MDSNLYLISLNEVPYSLIYEIKHTLDKAGGWVEVLPHTFVIRSSRDVNEWTRIIEFHLRNRYPFIITKIDRGQTQGWLHNSLWERLHAL